MTLLAPAFLAAAALGALAVVALHFLARRRPPAAPLPTARFVPDRPVRATSRAPRPTDLVLLVVRVLLLLLVGAAFAGLARAPDRRPSARVVVVDRSRGAADAASLRERALAAWRRGDEVVLADSVARRLDPAAAEDSLRALAPLSARGSLTAALVAAQRAAGALAERADSVEIVLLSPLVAESLDSATLPARRAWPGAVRVVRVPARPAEPAPRIALRAAADDPVAATVALLGLLADRADAASVRLVRETPTGADSVWAASAPSRALVRWPAGDGILDARTARDTIGAVAAPGAVAVAAFERRLAPGGGRVVARWADGEPAAAERALGAGCVRDVAIPVAARGDLALRPEMQALVRTLAAPCGGPADLAPIADSVVALLAAGEAPAGAGRRGRAGRAVSGAPSLAASVAPRTALAPWLLGAALLLALAEGVLRRRDAVRGSAT